MFLILIGFLNFFIIIFMLNKYPSGKNNFFLNSRVFESKLCDHLVVVLNFIILIKIVF